MAKRKRRPQKRKSIVDLDIVIPVFGQPDLLNLAIEAARESARNISYNLWVVDDQSPNPAEMRSVYSSLRPPNEKLLYNLDNKGFPFTANRGALAGNAPTILFLNSDVILYQDAIDSMLATLYAKDNIPASPVDPGPNMLAGIVGAKLFFPENSHWNKGASAGKVQHAGLVFNEKAAPVHVFVNWSKENERHQLTRSVQAVTGAALMIRRKLWTGILEFYRRHGDSTTGAFNEVYGQGQFEDCELCLMARAQGYRVIIDNEARGIHSVYASAKDAEKKFETTRNLNIFRSRCAHLVINDAWFQW